MDRTFFINRNFFLLWISSSLSSFGEFLVNAVVTVWLVSDLLKNSPNLPLALGLTVAAMTVPRIVIAPFAGAWVDNARHVRVMVIADIVRVLTTALFIAVEVWGGLTPWQTVSGVSLLLLVNATAAQFFNPARACIMQVAIPHERRIEASAKAMFSMTGVGIFTSALGPLLFGWAGALPAFGLAVVGLVGSALCVAAITGLPSQIEPSEAREPYWKALASGVRLAWTHRTIRLMMCGTALYGISLGINNPVLPLFGMQTLQLEPSAYGVLMAAFPLGGLLGTLLSARLSRNVKAETLTCGALLLLGLANLAYALSRGYYTPMLAMFVSGVCFALYIVTQGPVLQKHVPAGYMGRISSLSNPVLSIASVLATAGVTTALSHVNARQSPVYGMDLNSLALVVSAVIVLMGATLMLRSLMRSLSGLEAAVD